MFFPIAAASIAASTASQTALRAATTGALVASQATLRRGAMRRRVGVGGLREADVLPETEHEVLAAERFAAAMRRTITISEPEPEPVAEEAAPSLKQGPPDHAIMLAAFVYGLLGFGVLLAIFVGL